MKIAASTIAGDDGAMMLPSTKQLVTVFCLTQQTIKGRQHADLIIKVLGDPVSLCRTKERLSYLQQLKEIRRVRNHFSKIQGDNNQAGLVLLDLARAILRWKLGAFEISFALLEDAKKRIPVYQVPISLEWQLAILKSTHYPRRALTFIKDLESGAHTGGLQSYQKDIRNLKKTLEHITRLGFDGQISDAHVLEWERIMSSSDSSNISIDMRIKGWLLSLFHPIKLHHNKIAKPSTLRRIEGRRESETYLTDPLISAALYAQNLNDFGDDEDEITIFEKVRSKVDSVPDLEFQLILWRAFMATAAARKLDTVKYLVAY